MIDVTAPWRRTPYLGRDDWTPPPFERCHAVSVPRARAGPSRQPGMVVKAVDRVRCIHSASSARGVCSSPLAIHFGRCGPLRGLHCAAGHSLEASPSSSASSAAGTRGPLSRGTPKLGWHICAPWNLCGPWIGFLRASLYPMLVGPLSCTSRAVKHRVKRRSLAESAPCTVWHALGHGS